MIQDKIISSVLHIAVAKVWEAFFLSHWGEKNLPGVPRGNAFCKPLKISVESRGHSTGYHSVPCDLNLVSVYNIS